MAAIQEVGGCVVILTATHHISSLCFSSVLPILSFTYSVVPSFSPEIKDLANLELSPCLPLFLCMMTDNPCWHTDLHPTLSCRTLDTLLMVQSILLISQAQTHNKTIGNAPLIFYLNKMARSPN